MWQFMHHVQQRFFAIIELALKPFESGQGPVNFGNEDPHTDFITITDGNIALSSHHDIHGATATHVTISSVNTMNFDVTDIQCNGCNNVSIENVVIDEQNTNIPVNRGKDNDDKHQVLKQKQ